VTSFAGAGVHHHNGTAEHAIQTIMNMSCTMMLHAAIHWPDVADLTLWPMVVAHAVYLYNHMPALDTGFSCLPKHDGNSGSIMMFMFGDGWYMCWIRLFQMARSYHV
jgi:hypothetical protein